MLGCHVARAGVLRTFESKVLGASTFMVGLLDDDQGRLWKLEADPKPGTGFRLACCIRGANNFHRTSNLKTNYVLPIDPE